MLTSDLLGSVHPDAAEDFIFRSNDGCNESISDTLVVVKVRQQEYSIT